MVKKIHITMADWLLNIIEEQKKTKNRSEFIAECIVKGLGFDKPILDPKYIEELTQQQIIKLSKV